MNFQGNGVQQNPSADSELRLSQETLLKLQENYGHIQNVLLKIAIKTSQLL